MALILTGAVMMGGQVFANDTRLHMDFLRVIAQQVAPSLAQNTVIKEQNVYICGDIEEMARKSIDNDNVKASDLKAKYTDLGYTVDIKKGEVIARRKVDDFCSYHRSLRHLGIYKEKLAVFQGPIGYDQKLLKVEDAIPIQSLSAEFQVKLQQASNFSQMTPETQAQLRSELEFANEDALNAILENLDEMQY
ncbi:hypothetical protein Desca_1236 [Desulfotomaculum nigrificans CO-1-SRB]|uniref:Bypass of forespore C C-terminal domain-containing protein n=1 Tax=Desulfotomaculum nigrificans (strain DSM 14880 / VKM B-2319 / CO-1-SRB) TaxID=868595 RepID=F6B441_DESCC|nr:hypothetical protein Desca_1236 [Desulfotomaculum nigrificans CO-1-SRB]